MEELFNNLDTTLYYNPKYLQYINDRLSSIPSLQRSVILASIIQESGGDPLAVGPGGFKGLLQWSNDRYNPKSNDKNIELQNQTQHILNTIDNITDKMSWTHGGKGSGYNSLKDAYNTYSTSLDIDKVNHAFVYGFVRPTNKESDTKTRLNLAKQIYKRLNSNNQTTVQKPKLDILDNNFWINTQPPKTPQWEPIQFRKGGKWRPKL